MNKNKFDLIKEMYQKILLSNKINGKSPMLFQILSTTSNKRLNMLSESLVPESSLNPYLDELLEEKLVCDLLADNNFTLTIKGIYSVEETLGMINKDALLEFLQSKSFPLTDFKPSDRMKLQLFTLISMGVISSNNKMFLNSSDERINENWKEITIKCFHFLSRRHVFLNLKEDKVFGKSKTEHPVVNLFRHNDDLPKLTKGLFKTGKNMTYYLDIEDFDKKKYKKLFKIIFENIDFKLVQDFCEFSRNMISNYDIKVFDQDFELPDFYEKRIREALLDI